MKITKEILKAFNEIKSAMGDYAELSRKSGVAKSTISRYVNGTTKSIDDSNWEKLFPFLVPYLNEVTIHQRKNNQIDTVENTSVLRECIKDAMLKKGIKSAGDLNRLIGYDSVNSIERLLSGKINWFPDVLSAVFDALEIEYDNAPITASERMLLAPEGIFNDGAMLVRPIPVVDWANAASYISNMISGTSALSYHWDPDTTETIPAPIGCRKGTVALKVNGQSMEPKIQDGDKLFCAPVESIDEITNGKIVVVRFSDHFSECPDCIVCKRFHRIAGTICLSSDNPSGRRFDEVSPEDIVWIRSVVGKYSDDF